MRHAVVFVVSLALIGPALAGAESLGEVAAREREKRKGKPAPKVITESDLGKTRGRGNYNNPDDASVPPPDTTEPASAGEASAAGSAPAAVKPADPGAPKEKTRDEVRAEGQAEWKKKYDEATGKVTTLQATIARIQGRPNLYADAQGQADLEKAKKDLADAQQAVANLDTERRRAGYR